MSMKKTLVIFAAAVAAFALSSCNKEVLEGSVNGQEQVKTSEGIKLNITVGDFGGNQSSTATKAVKTGWEDGDQINIWYGTNCLEKPDLVIKYNSTTEKWETDASASVSGNTPDASGTLNAIYVEGGMSVFTHYDTSDEYYAWFNPTISANKYDNHNLAYAMPLTTYVEKASYTYSEKTLTATLDAWSFSKVNNTQIVITGLPSSDYALCCDNMSPCYGIIFSNGGMDKCESAAGYYVLPVSNADGGAYMFRAYSGTDFTFTLCNADGTDKRTYSVSGKTLDKTGVKLNAIKIPFSKFEKSITETDLSASATANCYIVSAAGDYKFQTVRGNSTTSVGTVASAEVLWESFGTYTAPSVGDLVSSVSYADGYITFTASALEGNAVIAAKDASGTILWSWHIWLTDQPVDQVYNNGAGTLMDRNLGATSATPGDVHALGLLYQWGRKDPFLGGSSISYASQSKQDKAASTITWPAAVSCATGSNGTIAYAQANPTTFIKGGNTNGDWYLTGTKSTDNTRWTTSDSTKGLYDPCPAGYRVPDGGPSGVWATSFGTSSDWSTSSNWDSTNYGMNFGATDKTLGSASTIWYPGSGWLDPSSGDLSKVGNDGTCWSASPYADDNYYYYAHYLYFNNNSVYPATKGSRAYGRSVRCCKE